VRDTAHAVESIGSVSPPLVFRPPRPPTAEQRIAKGMHDADVSYFGRLVMSGDGRNEWISASRYGSIDDAHRGTAAVKTLMAPELDKWFSSYDSVIGRAVRVLEI